MATLLAQLVTKDALSKSAIEVRSQTAIKQLLTRSIFAVCLNCTKQGCNPPTAEAIDAAITRGSA